jgi:hypothetical protein
VSEPTIIGAPSGDNSGGDQGGQLSGAGEPGQGGLPEREWVKDLPEPLKASKTLRKFSDDSWKADLAKSYVELEGKLGKSVVLPDADAKPEEWEKFFSHVGRPQKSDEYDSSGGKLSPDFETEFKASAFAAGLTKTQYQRALQAIIVSNEKSRSAYKAVIDAEASANDAKLRTEFGKDYDEKIKAAGVAMGSLFPDAVLEGLKSSGIVRNPDFMKAMANYGAEFGETKLVKGALVQGKKDDGYDWVRKRFPANR